MRTIRSTIVICLASMLLAIQAKASDLFTYQGKLTSADAITALPDGQYRIGVRIWDAPSGGTEPLWARKYDVPVQNGIFSLMIGSEGIAWENPAPLTASLKLAVSGTDRFLEITVMSEADGPELAEGQWNVLQPRQKLNAVPYAMNGVPTGTVVPFAGSVAPDGWVICDGQTLDGADPRFASLFVVVSATFGEGETESEFKIPDLRGRAAIGSGQGDTEEQGQVGTLRLIGEKIGTERHTLTVDEMAEHNHGGAVAGTGVHSHSFNLKQHGDGDSSIGSARPESGNGNNQGSTQLTGGGHSHGIIAEGNDQPHNNMQPSLVLNYIIKL